MHNSLYAVGRHANILLKYMLASAHAIQKEIYKTL